MLQWKSKQPDALFTKIQGPSLESYLIDQDERMIGIDMVPSIRCQFWPSTAMEWIDRTRHYGWPSQCDINTIVSFGFHLVAVGHHLSPMKSLQWRISFSIAGRTLVWSFSHTQIQCYAVMKLILKEFIKVKSSEGTKGVLCSYFVKTFLFWQYEETDPSFWQRKNLRGCIMFLLRAFSICIQEGVLRHYFIPTFNLLEVKLTRDTKSELLHFFDKVIQYDITVMAHCLSLVDVWSYFLRCQSYNQSEIIKIRARQKFDLECILMNEVYFYQNIIYGFIRGKTIDRMNLHRPWMYHFEHIIHVILDLLQKNFVKSPLASFVLRGL